MKKIANDDKLHFIHFLIKLIFIGTIFFFIVEIGTSSIIKLLYPDLELNSYLSNDFIGHYYCGTFFIEMLISKNFKSVKAYELFLNKSKLTPILHIFSNIITTILTITILILIYLIFKKIKNKEVFNKGISNYLIILGILYLINNIIAEFNYLEIKYLKDYAVGFLKTTTYYPQIYHIFVIPIIIISTGFIFKHYELNINQKSTKMIDKLIKTLIILIGSVSSIFILYRLGIRVYELTGALLNRDISIKLPFYGYMMELSYDYALSQNGYLKLVILRFIKDLPCFIASIISVTLFIKILLSSVNNHINTKKNMKRINICLISLFIASIIFNILGLLEINILHENFIDPFNGAVYTIALRSFCEPLLYGLVLYFMKIFINILPKEN